jgi:hypothetical protein
LNPLTDLLPAKWRRILYILLAVVSIGVGAWQTANGNLLTAFVSFVGTLTTTLAGSNVTESTETNSGVATDTGKG